MTNINNDRDSPATTLNREILALAHAGDCGGIIRLIETWKDSSRPAPAPTRKAMSVADAATALGVSPRTIWRQLGLGSLDAVRIGRCTRISAASVDRLVKAGGCS